MRSLEHPGTRQGAQYVQCPACGNYWITQRWFTVSGRKNLDDEWDRRARLCGVIRRETDRLGSCETLIDSEASEDDIRSRHDAPRSPLEQMEMFLVMVAEEYPFVGANWLMQDWRPVARRVYFPTRNRQDFIAFIGTIATDGYLELKSSVSATPLVCGLTREGLELVEQARTRPRCSKQAFVAMWFAPAMDAAFTEGIGPALEACGYKPYRVDREASENKIDDEIIANIRKSRLMVADLTGMRPNVFYEAGMAHGLGLSLLLTCKDSELPPQPQTKSWFEDVAEFAFDIRQYYVLRWTEPADLRTELETRIRALGYDLNDGSPVERVPR